MNKVSTKIASLPAKVDAVLTYDHKGNPLYTEYADKTTRSELYGTQAGGTPEGAADTLSRFTRFRRRLLGENGSPHSTPRPQRSTSRVPR